MSYASWSVVFGEQPSAAKWNILGINDAAFNDGTGIPSANATSTTVLTSQTTTSTSFTGLATALTVTATVGTTGLLLVGLFATSSNSGADAQCFTSFALSGANTLASSDANAVQLRQTTATAQQSAGITRLFTGLTPGSTVATQQYRVTGNTGTWLNRHMYLIPL